jgi:hypothetical protein
MGRQTFDFRGRSLTTRGAQRNELTVAPLGLNSMKKIEWSIERFPGVATPGY